MNDIALNTTAATERILDEIDNGPPIINYGVSDAVTTGYALIAADDGQSGLAPKRELARLTACNERLGALVRATPPEEPDDKSDASQQLLATMSSIRGVIRLQARFPTARPEVRQARALGPTLFGLHASLQRKRQRDVWLASDHLIKKVDASNDTAAQVDLLVGSWALETLRPLHARVGAILGITAALPAPGGVNLLDDLREHREQAAAYERAVLGEMDARDLASVQRARALLAPLVKLREELRTALAKGEEEDEDEDISAAEAPPVEPEADGDDDASE